MSSDLTAILAKTDLFSTVGDDARSRIAEVGRVEHWKEGAIVLEEGAYGPRMMVILKGSVEILRRDPAGVQRAVSELSSGQVLGEMSLLLELPRTATVRAQQDLEVFAIDRQAFQDLVEADDPAFLRLGFALSRMLARRLMSMNDHVIGLLSENPALRQRFGEARQELFELWDVDEES